MSNAAVIAYTSSGVEMVTPIDPERLNALAKWICDEACITNMQDCHKCTENCVPCDDFAHQRSRNGYCDRCRDFAGRLLAEAPLG